MTKELQQKIQEQIPLERRTAFQIAYALAQHMDPDTGLECLRVAESEFMLAQELDATPVSVILRALEMMGIDELPPNATYNDIIKTFNNNGLDVRKDAFKQADEESHFDKDEYNALCARLEKLKFEPKLGDWFKMRYVRGLETLEENEYYDGHRRAFASGDIKPS